METTFKQDHITGREPRAPLKTVQLSYNGEKNRPTALSKESLKATQKPQKASTDTVRKYLDHLN
jgi:hypothetical protein